MRLKQLHYSWIMVTISVGILVIVGLQFHCFGVFLKPMATDLNWDRGTLSLGYSMMVLEATGQRS